MLGFTFSKTRKDISPIRTYTSFLICHCFNFTNESVKSNNFLNSAVLSWTSDGEPFWEVGQILFIIFFSASSWVSKSVASLGKEEGRMAKNYYFFFFFFGSHFYNPLKSLRLLFCFTTFTFASEEQKINVDVRKLMWKGWHRAQSPLHYTLDIYALFLNIFYCLFSLLLI